MSASSDPSDAGDERAAPMPGDGLAETLGVEAYERPTDAEARLRLPVSDRVRQPYGIVHGGAYSTLAETLASRATWESVRERGMGAFGQSNMTSFLRPILEGHVNACGRAVHRGRTSWVWEIEMSDDQGRVAALARVTVAVRPLRGEAEGTPSPETGS